MSQIDKIDAKILRELINDSRVKLTYLSKICKISIPAVKNRINKLERNRVIIGSSLSPNMAAFGYPFPVLIGINLEYNCEEKITKLVRSNTNVAGIDRTFGKYDLCLFAFSQSVSELNKLKQKLMNQKSVNHIDINIWGEFRLNYNNIDL